MIRLIGGAASPGSDPDQQNFYFDTGRKMLILTFEKYVLVMVLVRKCMLTSKVTSPSNAVGYKRALVLRRKIKEIKEKCASGTGFFSITDLQHCAYRNGCAHGT
jgi:hypothetical protein